MDAVKQTLFNLLDKIKQVWGGASKKAKLLFIAIASSLILFLIIFVVWINQTTYVALASGLSDKDKAGVLDALTQANIQPQITSTGTIMVSEDEIDRARMQVAQRTTGDFGYGIYEGLGITATQADKNQAVIYQTQDRLEKMIETYNEIENATVQLSIPQPSIYALQGDNLPPTASIKIEKRTGYALSAEQVQGIINLVKNSVSGLKEENISIVDENGDLKAQMTNNAQNSSLTKLELTEQVNSSVKTRVLRSLQAIYGADNVQVEVHSVLDTDTIKTHETTYLPADESNPSNNPINMMEREREKVGGADAPAQGVPGTQDNTDIPQYLANNLDVEGADSWRSHDIYDFLVSSVVKDINKEGLEIKDMTVGVMINTNNLPGGILTDTERDKVIDWVSGATGLTLEKIKVQSTRFQTGAVVEETGGFTPMQVFITAGIAFIALSIMLIIIFMNIQKRNREKAEAEAAEAAALAEAAAAEAAALAEALDIAEANAAEAIAAQQAAQAETAGMIQAALEAGRAAEEDEYEDDEYEDDEDVTLVDLMNEEVEFEPIQFVETKEQKLKAQIHDLAISDPEIVAQLIKTWLVND